MIKISDIVGDTSGDRKNLKRMALLLSFFFGLSSLFPLSLNAQEVEARIDSASIKIGEQITYSISVQPNAEDDVVIFPEGQTFAPLEMVETFPIDTSRGKDGFRLLKEYMLTQFDSGSYSIPRQRVLINEQAFFTDSLLVEVRDVVVDTTKQKLYPIKPAVEVPSGVSISEEVWWTIFFLLVVAVLIYLFFRRKHKKEEAARKLPPYEQAIFELKQLDESHLLEDREFKEYYSQLSAAIRRYLDGEVFDHALESTTGELIAYLEAERTTGKLNLSEETILKLKQILHRADLAKFANSRPDVITAREDRSNAEFVINDTKQAIPQPTEEELLQDQVYREQLENRRKRKKIIVAVAVVFLAAGSILTYLVATEGFDSLVGRIVGNPTKDLLEGDWIRSEYGNPPVAITTPEVLVRGNVALPAEAQAMMSGSETFLFGNLTDEFFTGLTTMEFRQDSKFDLETAVDGVYEYLESQGARNILMKQEDFETLSGTRGIKIFGSMDVEDPKSKKLMGREYAILNFAENNGFQQITLIFQSEDPYAEEVAQRILDSVELNNTED